MKNRMFRNLLSVIVLASFLSLIGCAATHTAVSKRKLDVQTKMSETIFLDPVGASKRTIFVQVRNTSDKEALDLASPITDAISAKGYTVTTDPDQAHYLLQANVLHVGEGNLNDMHDALQQGYGSAIGGAVVGAAAGSLSSNNNGAVIGGLVGAAVATIADAAVKDIVFTAITDIQISERAGNNLSVQEKTKSTLKQGTSGSKIVTSTETTNWKRYQTRIVSTANKVNLKFKQAEPELTAGLIRSISGLF